MRVTHWIRCLWRRWVVGWVADYDKANTFDLGMCALAALFALAVLPLIGPMYALVWVLGKLLANLGNVDDC